MEAVERVLRVNGWINIMTNIVIWVDYAVKGFCIHYYFSSFLESRFRGGRFRENRLGREKPGKSLLERKKPGKNRFGKGKPWKNRLGRGKLGKKRPGNEKLRQGWLIGLLVVAVTLLEVMVREALAPGGFETTSYGILRTYGWQLGFLFLVGVLFYRVHYWKTLFVILSFYSVYLIAGLLTSMELLLDDRLRGVLGDWLAMGRITWVAYAWLWVALTVLYSFFCAVVFYWLLRRIVKNFREKEMVLHGKEVLQLLIPSLTGLCLCAVLALQVYGMEEGFYALFSASPFLCIVVSLVLLLSLLSILHGVTMFQDMYALNRERKGRAVLEKQVSALQEYVGERERIWSGVRGLKHDMRNTLSVAMRIAEKGGEGERLQAYLEQLSLSLDAFETEFHTGNVVADALLDMKCHEARKRIPELQVEVEELAFPGTLAIQDYDIGVILGNALDNAVEACERLHREEPGAACFIRLSSFLDGEMFLMEIRNNFDGKLITREGKEFPDTGKADGESHGIGLANIKSTCEKYHGTVEWTARDGVFTLSVMLRNTNAFDHEYKLWRS